uniref:Uncharacterized protein n=1 Tax=Peronospora matthiolae TaxID=2874970 RepID=A0AAV1TZ90_9STRA
MLTSLLYYRVVIYHCLYCHTVACCATDCVVALLHLHACASWTTSSVIVAIDLVTAIFFFNFFSLVVDESDDDVVDESDNDAGGPEVCDARNAFVACVCAS